MTPRQSVASRRWAFAVNTVAASPWLTNERRLRLLQRQGLDIEPAQIYPRCYFHSANLHVGRDAMLNHGVHIENVERVVIGPRTQVGIFTTIVTSTHEIGDHEMRAAAWHRHPVSVGAGCWLGARVLILPGVTVGDGCIVAAGAVVADDCRPDGLYAGVPARRVRDL